MSAYRLIVKIRWPSVGGLCLLMLGTAPATFAMWPPSTSVDASRQADSIQTSERDAKSCQRSGLTSAERLREDMHRLEEAVHDIKEDQKALSYSAESGQPKSNWPLPQ